MKQEMKWATIGQQSKRTNECTSQEVHCNSFSDLTAHLLASYKNEVKYLWYCSSGIPLHVPYPLALLLMVLPMMA